MSAKSNIDEMAGFLVRWTKEDLRNDVPQRLKKALKLYGGERAPLSRSLLIHWLEDIERRGPISVKEAVERASSRRLASDITRKK